MLPASRKGDVRGGGGHLEHGGRAVSSAVVQQHQLVPVAALGRLAIVAPGDAGTPLQLVESVFVRACARQRVATFLLARLLCLYTRTQMGTGSGYPTFTKHGALRTLRRFGSISDMLSVVPERVSLNKPPCWRDCRRRVGERTSLSMKFSKE